MSLVVKPVNDANIRDFCISEFLEMGEYLLSCFFLGSFVCLMKIVCGINLGHYQFRLKGAVAHL